jgi:hypothetical protein
MLSNYQKTIEELLADLESHFGNKVRRRLRQILKWPMKEPKAEEFIQKLSRFQRTFQQALGSDLAWVHWGPRHSVKY